MDDEKVKAILEWSLPQTITKVRNFYDLANFYIKFIMNLSSIVTPISDCTKGKDFVWNKVTTGSFEILKKVSKFLILVLPDFNKVFKVNYDASFIRIGSVLSQEG